MVPTVRCETSIDCVYDCCFVLVGLFGLVLLPYSFGSARGKRLLLFFVLSSLFSFFVDNIFFTLNLFLKKEKN